MPRGRVIDAAFPEWRPSLITDLRKVGGLTLAQIAHGCRASAAWVSELETNPSAEPRYTTACLLFAMHRAYVVELRHTE